MFLTLLKHVESYAVSSWCLVLENLSVHHLRHCCKSTCQWPEELPIIEKIPWFQGNSITTEQAASINKACELSFSLLLLDRTALPLGKASIIPISTLPTSFGSWPAIDRGWSHGRVQWSCPSSRSSSRVAAEVVAEQDRDSSLWQVPYFSNKMFSK